MTENWQEHSPWPHLLVAGVPKSATTTLAAALVNGGDVVQGRTKEPGIITNSDYRTSELARLYRSHYSSSETGEKLRMDATPWIFYDPGVIDRLPAVASHDRRYALVALREPWSRMQSMYRDQCVRGRERRSFERALADELDRLDVDPLSTDRTTAYLRTSLYGRALAHWLAAAEGSVETRVTFFDDLTETTRQDAVRQDISGWLGVRVGPFEHRNKAGSPAVGHPQILDRATQLGKRLPRPVRSRVRANAVPVLARITRGTWSRGRRAPKVQINVPASLRAAVDRELAEDASLLLEQLADRLLGRLDLPPWI